jgi:hypothetical protein
MWQEIIVGLCVIGALVFLVRRWLPMGKKKSAGCDSGCSGCASTTACQTPPAPTDNTRRQDSGKVNQ